MAREKICARHFDALSTALKKKGMWHLVAKTEVEAKLRARNWLEGQTPAEKFDPLAVSVLEIYKNASDTYGMLDMCPLCAANRVYQKTDADVALVDNVSDLMLVVCLSNNLIRRPNGHKIIL